MIFRTLVIWEILDVLISAEDIKMLINMDHLSNYIAMKIVNQVPYVILTSLLSKQ